MRRSRKQRAVDSFGVGRLIVVHLAALELVRVMIIRQSGAKKLDSIATSVVELMYKKMWEKSPALHYENGERCNEKDKVYFCKCNAIFANVGIRMWGSDERK